MNTRVDLYANEAGVLLETMATYRTLRTEQLYKLFPPEKAGTVKMLLKRYVREQRLFLSTDERLVSADAEIPVNGGLIKAFWVLLDFIDKSEYHTAGIFPVLICFFADGELYEIISVPSGQEAMISTALKNSGKEPSKRILILDDINQAAQTAIPGIAGFCLVSDAGKIQYFKKESSLP